MYSDTAKNIDPNLPDGLGAEARRYLQAIKHELHCPRVRKALFFGADAGKRRTILF